MAAAVLLRENRANELENAGAEIVVGDLTNPDSIHRACKDIDLILTAAHGMSVRHIPGPIVKVFSKVLKPFHPGIGRILKLSAFGETSDCTMNSVDSIQ